MTINNSRATDQTATRRPHTRREHNAREDVVADSAWAPFVPTDRSSPMLRVEVTPPEGATEVRVRSHGGRSYETRIRSLLAAYHRVANDEQPGALVSRPAVAVEPRAGLVRLPVATTAPPIAMADESGAVVLNGHQVPGYLFQGAVVVVAGDLDAPFGYAPGGVADLIQGEWKAEILSPAHFRVLRGDDLREFKACAKGTGVAPVPFAFASVLTILTEAGVDRVTLLTKKKVGVDARAFTADEVFHKLRRGEAVGNADVRALPSHTPAPAFDEERFTRIVTGAVVAAMPAMLAGAVQVLRPLMLLPGSAPTEQPPALPIPSDWITSTQMATKLPLTKARIDRLIAASAIRGNTDLARQVPHTWTDAHGSHTEPRWNYDPSVTAMVKRLDADATN